MGVLRLNSGLHELVHLMVPFPHAYGAFRRFSNGFYSKYPDLTVEVPGGVKVTLANRQGALARVRE